MSYRILPVGHRTEDAMTSMAFRFTVGTLALAGVVGCGQGPALGTADSAQRENAGAMVAPTATLRGRLVRPDGIVNHLSARVHVTEPAAPADEPCTVTGTPSAQVGISTKPQAELAVGGEPRYDIYNTSSLIMSALLRNVCGTQTGAFDLYAPDGSFYKRISLRFTADGPGEGARKSGDGYLVETALP